MAQGQQLLKTLILASEKAARISRRCRSNQSLFDLLIEEKVGVDKNSRFVHDFKTLADVLVQEAIKHDIVDKFPELCGHVYGEESNKFTNGRGDSVYVEVQGDQGKTSQMLGRVLDNNIAAADALAAETHSNLTTLEDDHMLSMVDIDIDTNDIGFWIDPIDSTAEYIRGDTVEAVNGVYPTGLQCVTVLIGGFTRSTGLPLCGVINQPFHHLNSDGEWCSRVVWGLHTPGKSYSNGVPNSPTLNPEGSGAGVSTVIMSPSEHDRVKTAIASVTRNLVYTAGAGYKMLCVIDGTVDAYILSKASTFKWDTCGPHAILLALGGGCVNFNDTDDGDDVTERAPGEPPAPAKRPRPRQRQLSYSDPELPAELGASRWSNSKGLFAFKDIRVFHTLIAAL